jgi:hypothetical protein
MRDFVHRRFRADRSAVTMLVTIIAGADDELIFSDKIRGDGPCPGLLNRRQSSRWHGWILDECDVTAPGSGRSTQGCS